MYLNRTHSEPVNHFSFFVVCSETGEVLSRMTTGDFFGEIGILNLDGGVNR
jgi:CRP-like cAMP-binding protein